MKLSSLRRGITGADSIIFTPLTAPFSALRLPLRDPSEHIPPPSPFKVGMGALNSDGSFISVRSSGYNGFVRAMFGLTLANNGPYPPSPLVMLF